MKCNELMVGDWISHVRGLPMQVMSVGINYLYADFEGNEGDLMEFDDNIYEPCPILLTDEFFKRNNFDEDVLYWIKGGSIHDVDGKDGYLIEIRMYEPSTGPISNVHYVHELQQLLRLGGYAELANNVKL